VVDERNPHDLSDVAEEQSDPSQHEVAADVRMGLTGDESQEDEDEVEESEGEDEPIIP
jgi:hypothetical protein